MLTVLYISVIAVCGVCVLVYMRGGLCGQVGEYTCAHGEARERYWVSSFVTLHWVPLREAVLLEPASPGAPLPSWCRCDRCVQPQSAVSMGAGVRTWALRADILTTEPSP